MIVADVNLLVYAHNKAASQHERARAWWEDLMTRHLPIGLPWAAVLGFIRLVSHSAVLVNPLTPPEAMARVRTWFAQPEVRVLDPGPRHIGILEGLFHATGVAGSLTTDTHLAALAIEHQAELHSTDGDFARFPGLRWVNPLR